MQRQSKKDKLYSNIKYKDCYHFGDQKYMMQWDEKITYSTNGVRSVKYCDFLKIKIDHP